MSNGNNKKNEGDGSGQTDKGFEPRVVTEARDYIRKPERPIQKEKGDTKK